jgi:hypothetical protein
MSMRLQPEELTMRHDIQSHDSMVELENMWRRLWLSLILVLAVMIGIGLIFTAVLHSYSEAHCRYLTVEPTLPRQSGLL